LSNDFQFPLQLEGSAKLKETQLKKAESDTRGEKKPLGYEPKGFFLL
jgi:glucosamine 6-phosphate synthetase-like amidotransferase/phosphosugar isomerase protein